MDYVTAIAAGYLIGSIPTAYIVARFYKGIDIRTVGSGNVGGSNVGMHVGKLPYVATLLFDLVKGALVVAVLEQYGFATGARLAAGLAAVIGHNWPVWLGFAGGTVAASLVYLFYLASDSPPWHGLIANSMGGLAGVGIAAALTADMKDDPSTPGRAFMPPVNFGVSTLPGGGAMLKASGMF